MRAAVYHSNNDIRLEEMPVPALGPGEILVRIEASGICGSDVMEWYRLRRAPLVLGHEIAGVVERAGAGVERFSPGERVFVSHHVPCNRCRWCGRGQHSLCDTLRTTNFDPGGFAEFVRVPRINVETGTFVIPERITFDEAALIEPLACVVRGLRNARRREGDSVLVLGSGISGLLFVKLLRALGAPRIAAVDISAPRREAARRMGADAALTPQEAAPDQLRELGGGRLFDLVVVSAGAAGAVRQAFASVERGGTVLLFAPLEPGSLVPLPLHDIWRDQVTIVSTYAGCPQDIVEALGLLAAGTVAVDDMITHRLPLARAGEGFRLVAQGGESIKVIVHPQE